MKFNRLNNIVGWIVFLIASAVYVLTAEKNGSLWDCGEFVASCYKLQIPHPPGAPMFVLLGRLFIIIFGDNPASAAKAVNIMSALASSATILFLFWTITHFARKLVNPVVNTITRNQALTIFGAGVLGALAYTFSDSFWYSAVEGEVYALSSFFTAIVFWAMLKWEHQVDRDASTEAAPGHWNADRWIIFIFFMMGLSIGVHLLNLLTIPAIVMIYYFKRYNVTRNGIIWAFLIGCVITGVVQKFVIQYSIKAAGMFDILFVNNFGLPFFSGFAFFFVLMALLIFLGLRYAQRKGHYYLRLGLWCFAFILVGYSSYVTTMIRSSSDPAIDMYNVDNPMSLVGYLGREQYGDFPLVYGNVFTAQSRNVEQVEGAKRFQKGTDNYIEIGRKYNEKFASSDKMLFPRVWDRSNDQYRADYYAQFLGIGKIQDPRYMDPETGPYERKPTFGDNIKFFVGYQTYWMYVRYFMWNFSGKQNDVQGVNPANVRDGNWITGLPFVDNLIYGPQDEMPETIRQNKSHNSLFALPLIFGLLGMFFQYFRNRRDFLVSFLLFFFTGMAIVLYLNQAGNQPRERDYAYVGSFYAFAIWIGLAIPAAVALVREDNRKLMNRILIYMGAVFVVGGVSGAMGSGSFSKFIGMLLIGVFAAAVIYGIFYLLKALKKENSITTGATVITLLLVPAWMAVQEWDDHDRSEKTLAPDLAVNYLQSVAPNAILISFGDNDTYPLWYAQEVLGVRKDVRVINYSLLGIDWYINQLRYKVNESAPVDVVYSADQILGDKLNVAYNEERPGFNGPQSLLNVLKDWIGTTDPSRLARTQAGEMYPIFPTKQFYIPVNRSAMVESGTVAEHEIGQVVDSIRFNIDRFYLAKNDLAVLSIIAANFESRPIYFTTRFEDLGFGAYMRRDGMAYRMVPIAGAEVNTPWAYDKMMKEFRFGNAGTRGVYFDEENRRHLNNIRMAFADVAMALTTRGQNDSASQLLDKVDKSIDPANMPYGLVSRGNMHNQTSLMMLEAAYRSGNRDLADKISRAVKKDLNEQMAYYNAIGSKADGMTGEVQRTQLLLQLMAQLETAMAGTDSVELAPEIDSAPVPAPTMIQE